MFDASSSSDFLSSSGARQVQVHLFPLAGAFENGPGDLPREKKTAEGHVLNGRKVLFV